MASINFISRVNLANNNNSKIALIRRVRFANKTKKKSFVSSINLTSIGLYLTVYTYPTDTTDLTVSISGTVSSSTTLTASSNTSGASIKTPTIAGNNWSSIVSLKPDADNTFTVYATKNGQTIKSVIKIKCLYTVGFILSKTPSRITVTDAATGVIVEMYDNTVIYNTTIKPSITNSSGNTLYIRYGNYNYINMTPELTLLNENTANLKALVYSGETITVVNKAKNLIYHIIYNTDSKVLKDNTRSITGPISWLYKNKKNDYNQTNYYKYKIDENKYVIEETR